MISRLKTPVAVLRRELGVSVEDFGRLIDKSVSTVTKLENGSLKLSEETAYTISAETGVAMQWLLGGNPKEKPYFLDLELPKQLQKQPYKKERFERIQANKGKKSRFPLDPAFRLMHAVAIAGDWLSVYSSAVEAGKGPLAAYLMRQFLDGLVERLGKDDEKFLELNAEARLILGNGLDWEFVAAKKLEYKGLGGVLLDRPTEKSKK